MKKIYLLIAFLFTAHLFTAQIYQMETITNGVPITVNTCKASVSIGGQTGYYPANSNKQITFYSGTPGLPIRINFLPFNDGFDWFYYDFETNYDYLRIYDNATGTGVPIATLTGTKLWDQTGLFFTSTTGYLTLRVNSDGLQNWYGFDAIIGCQPQNCNSNLPASDECTTAPVICELNGYCGNTAGWYTPDHMSNYYTTSTDNMDISAGSSAWPYGMTLANEFCGSIENNSWISFVAAGTSATFNVTSSGCLQAGSGIQAAVYQTSNCGLSNTFIRRSPCVSQSTGSGSFGLTATGLTVGQTYYVMVDGFAGNVCDYQVTATGGVATPSISSSAPTICPGQSSILTAVASGSGLTYSWTDGVSILGTGTSITVSPSTTTSYTCTITGACGASASEQVQVTVNPAPPSNAGTPKLLTCTATNTILSGSGGGTYSWTGPGIVSGGNTATPTVNQPGTYSLTVTSAGCTSTVSTVVVTQNITTPAVTSAASAVLNCNVTSVNVSATTGASPVTYNWSGTGITSAANISTITVNQPGTFNYTVTNTSNGCTTTGSQAVTQNITPPAVTSAASGVLNCTLTSVNVSATTGASPVTYNWSGTGITSAANISTITVNQPGTYNYTVTNTSNGCTATGSQAVTQNITTPAVTAAASGVLNCTLTSVNVSATTGASPVTYNWSGTGITSATNISTITVNQPGTFNYTVTNTSNGCTTTGSQAVTQNITTPAVTAAASGVLNCTVTSVNVSATTGASPVTYNWSGTGITSATNISTITVSQPGTFNYTVTNTSNGCRTIGSQVVTQNTNAPVTVASTTGSVTCITNTVNLISSLAGMNYTWTAPGGSSIVSGINAQNAVGQGLGTYSLNVLNPSNGCTYSTSIAAIQNTTTPTSVSAGPTQTLICGIATVTLSGSASPASATANWLGGVTSPNSFTTTTGSANIYTLQAINPATGCSITSTVQVLSSVGSPTATANAVTNSITCTNSMVTIGVNVTSSDPVTYQWPSTGISGPTNNATATATLAGVYNVTVTNNPGNNCSIQISITVDANTAPVTASVTPAASITCNDPSVTLSASPVGSPNTYSWSGTGITSGNTTSNPVVNQPGDFIVTITNSVTGCSDSYTVTVPSNTIAPTVSLTATSVTTTCLSTTVTLNATSNADPASTYSWTSPATGSLDNSGIAAPVASGSGIFTVVVTNTVSGCSSPITQNTVEVVADAGIPTVTLTPNTLSITCLNPAPGVTVTTNASPANYNWTPTSGIVSGTETTATPQFTAQGSYSLVVTNQTSGCSSSINSNIVNVIEDNASPVISLSGTGNAATINCYTTSISLTPVITPTANLTYTWSPSVGISTPVNQANVTFTAAGIYTLSVTNEQTGCVNTLTNTANTFTVITDNATPTFTLGTASSVTATCSNPTVALSGSSDADPDVIYTWLTPTSSTLTGNPVQVTGAGIYTVSVTNTLTGCSNANTAPQPTVEVIVGGGVPMVSLSLTSVSITCLNPNPTIAVTTTDTPVSYSWTPTTGIAPGTETTANPIFNAPGSYSVIVTNTISGCATNLNDYIVDVVPDNAVPTVTLFAGGIISDTITCNNPAVTADPQINTNSPNITYTWSPSIGMSSSPNQPIATFTAAGVYTLSITNTLTGCVSSSTNTANVFTVYDNFDTPTITATPPISTNTVIGCGGSNSTVTYSVNAVTPGTSLSYSWSTGATTSTVDITTAGVYSVIVTDNGSGCTSPPYQFTVTGSSTPPQNVNAGAFAGIPCGASTTTLNGSTTSTNVSYTWTGPVTSVITGSNTLNPTVNEAGTYTLTVTDNLTGCQSTDVVTVSQTSVAAGFTVDQTTGLAPLNVNFTNTSTGANSYSWNFGDGNGSLATDPTNIFMNSGSYIVTLTASSGTCTGTYTMEIVVNDGLTLEVPNVFTPNADGTNDVFTIKSTGVKEISLQIFNRWGEKLYEFAGENAAWDGKSLGGLSVPEGTYFYFVKAKGFDDKEIDKHGTVNLFR